MNTIIFNSVKRIILVVFWGVMVPIAVVYGAVKFKIKEAENLKQERIVTCPSLLSVARSARDTLIVMKNKRMCTEYMLDNLK